MGLDVCDFIDGYSYRTQHRAHPLPEPSFPQGYKVSEFSDANDRTEELFALPAHAAERPADVYVLFGQSIMQGTGMLAELPEEGCKPGLDVYRIKHYVSGQPLHDGWHKDTAAR